MEFDIFTEVINRRPIGILCPKCGTMIQINTPSSVKNFFKGPTLRCSIGEEEIIVYFYKYQENYLFSYRMSDCNFSNTFYVDIEKTDIIATNKNYDILELHFKYRDDLMISILLE